MPPLLLTSVLQTALPRLSPASRAVVSTLGCLNGKTPSAREMAAWVGPTRTSPASLQKRSRSSIPSTGQLYVTTAYFGGGKIFVINPTTRTITRTFVAGGSTRQVAFNAAGTVGFVPNKGGWVDFLK